MKYLPGIAAVIVLALASLSGSAQGARRPRALPCEGNACSDVRIWYDGCYQAINRGTKQVILILGEWSTVLSPGRQFTLKDVPKYPSCPQSFAGSARANY